MHKTWVDDEQWLTKSCASLARFRGQLRAGDYGFDDVRSLAVHVGLFLSIFWAMIDIYVSILNAQLVGTSAFSRVVVFALYAAVCFLTTLLVWPLYYGPS
jgi:hypothetical protein